MLTTILLSIAVFFGPIPAFVIIELLASRCLSHWSQDGRTLIIMVSWVLGLFAAASVCLSH